QGWLVLQAGADLQNANLAGLDLSDVDFSGADLRGANFSESTFSRGTSFTTALYNSDTRFPAGFSPPASAYQISPRTNLSGANLRGKSLV
ncbi:pentapeptide repeat-containing protein, partial [Haemophilus parainfluenzae]|uniref:pentapeptide repeat-containing protein n=1 Tax=Haemophilus parainfluenzae TaxID=729 RepID=UPI00157EFE7B